MTEQDVLVEPIVKLAATFSGWTDGAMRQEMASMREKRARGEYDGPTERNALDMLRDMAHVLSYRADPTSDAPERSREWGALGECSTCGFSEQYRSMDDAPDDCPACGTKWIDD